MTLTSEFQYELPATAIAQEAIEPRHAARLLDARRLTDHVFMDLPVLLQPGDLVVVNNTRVRPARLFGHKTGTGGKVEALLLRREEGGTWRALIRPARRLRAGSELAFGRIHAKVIAVPGGGVAELALRTTDGSPVEDALGVEGSIPLPPYFHGVLAHDDRYQTMFAKEPGSAAAPTAGLHFTPLVTQGLAERGVSIAEVHLEVGLDTFRPIGEDTIEAHEIHRERYRVPEATASSIAATRRERGRVVAVGTTVVRTLESAADAEGGVVAGGGEASLFIRPGYEFSVVDSLVTNFHAPGTTLIVLVAAILGSDWRAVYSTALERGYRFLSFGDAMLIDDLRVT
jgi:S-adenosylmethionine:tRNA ribosyltransferase-isomerase